MGTLTNQYQPDYAVPPGWVIEERLAVNGISHAEFARRCDRSAKLISEIISGKASIEPRTALQFEKVLGVDASIWLGIEADYQLRLIRNAETKAAKALTEWSKTFPVGELVNRGYIRKPATDGETVSELLAFFGVASQNAWKTKYGKTNVVYRHSPSFRSEESSLAAWLRLAEIDATAQRCPDYDEASFKAALRELRHLTQVEVSEALDRARQLSNNAGVALSFVKPLKKARLSGAAWWLSPRRPVIALSARHKTTDHLWFSLFHEAAHILLHSKRDVFVDEINSAENPLEAQANDWATQFLVPQSDWQQFVKAGVYRRMDICRFAEKQKIAPGIIVGRLQHEGFLPWNRLNNLKVRLEWVDQ